MASETLTYRFEEENLDSLRSDMEDLADNTETVGDRADDTAADLNDMASEGTDAADGVSRRMEDVEESLQDVADEASDTGASLEQGLDTDPVEDLAESATQSEEEFENLRDSIVGSSDALSGLQSGELSIGAGAQGSGALTAALGAAGVGQLSQIRSEMASMPTEFSFEVEGLEELTSQLEELNRHLEEAKEEAEEAKEETEELKEETQQAGSGSGLDNLGDDLSDVEKEADDAEEKMGNVADAAKSGGSGDIESMVADLDELDGVADAVDASLDGMLDGLGDIDGIESLDDLGGQLGDVASKAKTLAMAFGPVRGTILAAGAAAGIMAPKFGRLSRELQNAAANASEMPSEIQELANMNELLIGQSDPEQVGEFFKEFKLRMREAQEGAADAQEGFQRLGISMEQLGEMAPDEALSLVMKRLRKTSEEQRALTREQVLGGEAAEKFALMTATSADELERLRGVAEETTFSDDQLSRFAAMGRRLDIIGQRLQKLGGELLGIFEPVISSLLKGFDQLLRGITFVFDKIEDGIRNLWGMLQELDSEWFGTERRLEFNFEGGEGTDSEVPTEGGRTSSNPRQRFGSVMNSQAKQIARIRERAEEGLISEEEMLRQIVSARESTFKELQKIGQKAPDLFTDAFIDHVVSELKNAQQKLEQMASSGEEEPSFDVPTETVEAAEPESLETSMPSPSIEQPSFGLSSLKSAAKGADSVKDINNLIGATRKQFDLLNNDEAQAFVARLQKQRAEMKKNQDAAAAIGDAMARSVARSADRAFQALGQGVADAIFGGGGGGPGEAQSRLQLFNAKKQTRSLRKALRKGNISYRNFQLKMKAQQAKIQQRQEQLNNAMDSGFAKAAKSMLSAFKQMAKQLIAEITAVIAKMAVLKALTAAFSIGSGGFLGSVVSNLGGGAFLDSGASGGTVKQDGLAVIHEGEEIVPKKTVNTLKNLTQPSTPSVQPAAMGGGMNITVNVTGQTRTDGRDLKTAYDTTARAQRRKGRS